MAKTCLLVTVLAIFVSSALTENLNCTVVPHAYLESQLSQETIFTSPEDALWENTTSRWSILGEPEFAVAVTPDNENDLVRIVSNFNFGLSRSHDILLHSLIKERK